MRVFSLLLLSSLASIPFAHAAAPATGVPLGFRAADDSAIPAAVRDREKFIYRLAAPYYTSIDAPDYAEVRALPNLGADSRAQLDACKVAGLAACMIHFGSIRGTAFLDADGKSVWTNCHIVHEWLEFQKQQLLLAGVADGALLPGLLASPVPLTLTDVAGAEVYPAGSKAPALLTAAVFLSQRAPRDLECSLDDDAVKIRLPAPLAPAGIPRAQASPLFAPSQVLYVGGNPMPTTDRTALGGADSDGEHFYWTRGPIVARGADFDAYFASYGDYRFAFSNPYSEPLLADGIDGMSGSPVLDESGSLVGIYKGTLPVSEDQADIPLASVFIDVEGLGYVEVYADDLPLPGAPAASLP